MMQWYLQNIKGVTACSELCELLLFTAEQKASRKKRNISLFLFLFNITFIYLSYNTTPCRMHNLCFLQSISSITIFNTEVPHFQQTIYCIHSCLPPLIIHNTIYLYVRQFISDGRTTQIIYWSKSVNTTV